MPKANPTGSVEEILEKLFSDTGVSLTEIGWELAGEKIQEAKSALEAHFKERLASQDRDSRIDELNNLVGTRITTIRQLGEYQRNRLSALQSDKAEHISKAQERILKHYAPKALIDEARVELANRIILELLKFTAEHDQPMRDEAILIVESALKSKKGEQDGEKQMFDSSLSEM